MKAFSTLHIILLLILLLLYHCSSAQDFVVTTGADTIHGEIRPMMFGVEKKVQVKNDEGKETYSILETRLYSIDNVSYYPVKGPYGYTFMQLVKSGYLSLFRFQPEKSTVFSGTYLRKADGNGIELPNLGFKKQMTEFLSDCGDVSERIESGEMKRADIEQIVDDYNACIDQRTTNVRQDIRQHFEAKSAMTVWEDLEKAVKRGDDFESRSTALEMIADVKNRISRKEKVPNFILDGLKNALGARPELSEPLTAAIAALEE